MVLYICSSNFHRNLANFDYSFFDTLVQGIDEKLILAVVYWLTFLYLLILLLEIVLIILWKIFFHWYKRRKSAQFISKLSNRRPFIATDAKTGQIHRFLAVDKKHARRILEKTGIKWTILVEDPRRYKR